MERKSLVQINEEQIADTLRAIRAAAEWMSTTEIAEADRARMFAIHKAHDSLALFYQLFPGERQEACEDNDPQSAEMEKYRGRGR